MSETEWARAIVYWRMVREIDWQVETLRDMGCTWRQ